MKKNIEIQIIQHALDNGLHASDYSIFETLEVAAPYTKVTPEPCDILPRQFGYWFHTGPGFADASGLTYGHKMIVTDRARILGNDGAVVYSGDWVDTTSLNYARSELPGCQFTVQNNRLMINPVSRQIKGTCFLGFNAGHNNYAHWITDQLPLVYYFKDRLLDQGVRLLLPKKAASFVSEYMVMLDIPSSCIDYIGDEVVEVEHLIHGSFFSFDAIPVSAMDLLKGFIDSCVKPVAGPKKKIFISRNETLTRALLNETAVTEQLRKLGFEIVVSGRMSVAEQIHAFRGAECVVGVHGAGMANIAFCEPETRIIEIFPEYTVSSLFWMMASHFDLKYGAIFGTSFDQDIALTNQAGSWDAPFVINERALMQTVSACF